MSNITTRAGKGSELTHSEMDANFVNLNSDKVEKSTSNTQGGFLYLPSSATTIISATDTYYKASGTTINAGQNGDITTSDNRIQYTGALTRHFIVDISASLSCASNTQTISVALAINGVEQLHTEMNVFCKTAGEDYNVSLNIFAELTQNDYIEVFVKNTTGTGDVTFDKLQIRANSIYTT